jgi:hypothetical protein
MAPLRGRAGLLGLTLVGLFVACFGNPDTLGLPCTEELACFDGLVCGASGVCVEPSAAASTDNGNGDGDTGDGDTGDGDPGDGDPGDGDGESGDGDGDAESGDGDGDGETGDGDGDAESGDGDGETGDPVCGNGIREGSENCDGMDLGGMTCADHDYGGGVLACSSDCDLIFTECCLGEGQDCEVLANDCCGMMQCMLITFVCN